MAQLAAQGQRSGKFRHVFGEPAKADKQYLELRNPLTSGEARYCKANAKFWAVSRATGGGSLYVFKLSDYGRLAANAPLLSVQKGKVWDMDFNPFIPNMIATCSDDTTVAVTSFPIDGLKETITKPDVLLKGHGKKVVLTQFNPSANSILASGSFDRTVKVWNIEKEDCVQTFKDIKDNVYSLEWNFDGSQLAITGKDKNLRIFDPRVADEAASVEAFEGAKSSKCFWIPNIGWIGAVGFSKTARRQIRFWDLKDLSKPIFSTDIDQVSSVLMPYYDNDNGLLYLAGKGDGSINYSEIINDSKKWYPLGGYRNPEPQKGGGWIAKRACDVWRCEVNRFLKLTKNALIPISFIVPRKSGADVFQEDIFPDTYAGKPALNADDWVNGENKEPIKTSMDPEKKTNDDDNVVEFKKKKTYDELAKENEELRNRVAELEKQLGINSNDNNNNDDNNNNNNNNNEEQKKEEPKEEEENNEE